MIRYQTISFLTTLAVLSGLVSCFSGSIDEPESLDKDPLWESEQIYYAPSGEIYSTPNFLEILPAYNGVVMTGYTDSLDRVRYAGVNIESGKILWTSEEYTDVTQSVTLRYGVQQDELFYFYARETGNTPLYCYNVVSGELVHKKVYPEFFGGNITVLKALGDIFVSLEPRRVNSQTGYADPQFWVSTAPDFDTRDTLVVPLVNNYSFDFGLNVPMSSDVRDFELAELDNGDICLVFVVGEPKINNTPDYTSATTVHHINCYNISKQEWVYKNKLCDGGGNALPIDNGKLIFGYPGRSEQDDLVGLRAYDWQTGELLWHLAEFTAGIQVSLAYTGYEPDSETIVANEIGHIYGVDATTGKIKWKSDGIGNSTSPVLFDEGIAYSVSGGGALYGTDIATGERLLRASCPSEGRLVNGRKLPGFIGNIGKYIDEDGSAIFFAQNYLYTYAFEAVR